MGIALLCCGMLIAPEIWAFFPLGTFDSQGVLRFRTYRINDFDQNNDGQVGENEGIEVLLEGGRSGFTGAELDIVREAFAVWERVPQSYASFHEVGVFEDPVIADGGSDFQNTIVMQVDSTVDLDGDGLPDDDVVPDPPGVGQPLPPGVLGFNVSTWSGDDVVISTPSESYLVSSGTIIDNDIVIGASTHRPQVPGEEPLADLLSTMVHELGHFLGLGHTPLNNLNAELDPNDPGIPPTLVENSVMSHSIGGVRRRIGVTPTMFPFLFNVTADDGRRVDGGSDLAPDDLSAIAWLYPRGSQDLFFQLRGEARTRTRPGTGIPSIQVAGAHIVAWADVDNDPNTPRVPVFNTLTAYYENPENTVRDGRFKLPGMWKTMETESGLFNATYTYSMIPLNGTGFERQAPPGMVLPDFDYLGGRSGEFNTYPSEVFHEAGNIIDVRNKDAGTPFVWDFEQQTLTSVESGRTIENIVGEGPMFGDPNDVCILNVVGAAKAAGGGHGLTTAVEGAQSVRSIRDGLLLQTAAGSFVVDTYYKLSPPVARFLLDNGTALRVAVAAAGVLYWCFNHLTVVLLACMALLGVAFVARRRRAMRTGGLGVLMLAAAYAGTADARILYQTTEQLVSGATDVIAGRVVSAEPSSQQYSGHVSTDIVIEIDDKAKGTLNKQSTVTFTQLGGTKDGLITEASEFPTFKAGEEVILYLYYIEDFGFVVYNGIGGKTPVSLNKTTGEKTVKVPGDLRKSMAKDLAPGEEPPKTLSVSAYMAELRAIAESQEE